MTSSKLSLSMLLATLAATTFAEDKDRQLLWGDTHLHTSYSFDAFLNQNSTADPDAAYRWAKGMPVVHPYNRTRVQIQQPLDFLVVADHAEMLGVMKALSEDSDEFEDLGWWGNTKRWVIKQLMLDAIEKEKGLEFFGRFLPGQPENPGGDPVVDPANNIDDISPWGDTSTVEASAWADIVAAAEAHYEPGVFTSFIGWEWSSVPTGANLHRIVFTPNGAEQALQYDPFGSDQSQYPEDLWAWLDHTGKTTGSEFIAIPHNSNISKGYMFAETTLRGERITPAYATTRVKWEPVVEITQIKGDSETRSEFSPEDEFADFENFDHYIQLGQTDFPKHRNDSVRQAQIAGLAIEQDVGVNPFKFGVIGSTDSHSGLASVEEDSFWGKTAYDSIPERKERRSTSPVTFAGWDMSASGLAAVWADDNTREDIFAAFQRREVYATSGPRIQVRFFAGWDLDEDKIASDDFAKYGYEHGVPMGSDLVARSEGGSPEFLIRAVKDPMGANLDRLQVIKGWVDVTGQRRERVYDVAWSGDRQFDDSGRLPAVGNTVDLTTGHVDNSIGAMELSTKWVDPDFDESEHAMYYVRVLQIPTARHSLFDAIALKIEPQGPTTIQERAYTSPVWYTPQ